MAIALVMIAKNEERPIDRSLKSFRKYVDEIIVGDTGSTDSTIDVAKKYDAKIVKIDWKNDFSKARNQVLDHSLCDLNIVVDADEWLISGGSIIQEFGSTPKKTIGRIKRIDTFIKNNRMERAAIWISRVLPKGVCYQGRIHEQPVHALPMQKLPIIFGHDGYEPKRIEAKKNRNIQILLEELEINKSDEYYLYQIGKEYEIAGEYIKAADSYRMALKSTQRDLAYRHDLVVRSIFCFKHAGYYSEIFEIADRMEYPNSADFYFALGDAYLEIAFRKPELAEHLLKLIEICWLNCIRIGEGSELDASVMGRGSFLAAENLSIFYGQIGEMKKHQEYKDLADQQRKEQLDSIVGYVSGQ